MTERKWKSPFTASLFNEARDPHKTVSLGVCHEKIVIDGLKYRLTEFSKSGATYVFCGFDPTGTDTPHEKI